MSQQIIVPVRDGNLIATPSLDPNYPGIDIEFISNNPDIDTHCSNPHVLVEWPKGMGEDGKPAALRALIWNNPTQEDYTHNIKLHEWTPDELKTEPITNK